MNRLKVFFIMVVLFLCDYSFADYDNGISYNDVIRQKSKEMKSWPVLGRYDDFDYDACLEASIKRTGVKQGDRFGCWRLHLENCGMTENRLWKQLENLPHAFGMTDSSFALVLQVAQFERQCLEDVKMEPYQPKKGEKNKTVSYTQNFTKDIYKKLENVNKRIISKQSEGWHYDMRNMGVIKSLEFVYGMTYDEYFNYLNTLGKELSDKLFPVFLDAVKKEIRLISEGKVRAGEYCKITEKTSFGDLNEMVSKCTSMNLSSSEAKEFSENALKQRDYLTWKNARKQAFDSPKVAISEKSLIKEYLKQFPAGAYVDSANYLFELTLAKMALEEARKDTLLALSDKSLLKKYMLLYPDGKWAKKIPAYLEKLLYRYGVSQSVKKPEAIFKPDSYFEQYLAKFPKGEFRDSIYIIMENIYWRNYSVKCAKEQKLESCEPLFVYPIKFKEGKHLDSAKILIDEPMWKSIKKEECVFPENKACIDLEEYIQSIPNGRYVNEAKKVLSLAQKNGSKRDDEEEQKNEMKTRVIAWHQNYEKIKPSCSFVAKGDYYDYEKGERSFPEKNGMIECIEKTDLSLDSFDSLKYRCVGTENILVKGGKIVGGKGFCLNAYSDTLVRTIYLKDGKYKTTYLFPNNIVLSVDDKGKYSITSKKIKLKEIEFDIIIGILSFVTGFKDLSYLYDVEKKELEWTPSGQLKNIRVVDYREDGKVMGRLNIPLNSSGQMHGVSEIYTAATGNFKIEWSNGRFKRIYGGSEKLKVGLCPELICANLIDEIRLKKMTRHHEPVLEMNAETAQEGFNEGWMLHYIVYLLGITFNQGLEIWDVI